MKIVFFTFLLLSSVAQTMSSSAQVYHAVTQLSGIQNINGMSVTVTPSTTGSGSGNYCGGGPYWIGTGNVSGSYLFQFGTPINGVRIRVTAMNLNEEIHILVNGLPYTLTASNLNTYYGSCNQAQSILAGGVLVPPVISFSSAIGAGGELNISDIINAVTVMTPNPQGEGGSIFSIDFFSSVQASNNGPVCSGDSLKLFAEPEFAGATYSWTGPNNFSALLRNPIIPSTRDIDEGYYTVTCITVYGDTLIDSVFVDILPLPVTEITHTTPVCAGDELLFKANPSFSGVNLHWEGPNGFDESIDNPSIPHVQPVHSGLYQLTVTQGACSYITHAEVTVLLPAKYAFEKGICANETYNFNGKILDKAGKYTDTLIAANGCDSAVILTLTELESPRLRLSVTNNNSLCTGDTITVLAEGATTYTWMINNSLLPGTENTQSISLPKTDNQLVIEGKTQNGCADTLAIRVTTEACCDLFVPNAFSPNNDQRNDQFGIASKSNFNSFKLDIYNRWGQRVFSGTNPTQQWDGSINNIPAATGTYSYLIIADCHEGRIVKKGALHLIR